MKAAFLLLCLLAIVPLHESSHAKTGSWSWKDITLHDIASGLVQRIREVLATTLREMPDESQVLLLWDYFTIEVTLGDMLDGVSKRDAPILKDAVEAARKAWNGTDIKDEMPKVFQYVVDKADLSTILAVLVGGKTDDFFNTLKAGFDKYITNPARLEILNQEADLVKKALNAMTDRNIQRLKEKNAEIDKKQG